MKSNYHAYPESKLFHYSGFARHHVDRNDRFPCHFDRVRFDKISGVRASTRGTTIGRWLVPRSLESEVWRPSLSRPSGERCKKPARHRGEKPRRTFWPPPSHQNGRQAKYGF